MADIRIDEDAFRIIKAVRKYRAALAAHTAAEAAKKAADDAARKARDDLAAAWGAVGAAGLEVLDLARGESV